jgi:cysteine desulfurase/selenocysteine lyase
MIDGAQGVVHGRQSIGKLGPDFYYFSGHKIGAPTGTGVLYMKKELQDKLRPGWFGGGIVLDVFHDDSILFDGSRKFEAGTPNYAGVVGLGAAMDFWLKAEEGIGKEVIEWTEAALMRTLEDELRKIDRVHVLGNPEQRFGCISFTVDGLHSYDVCKMLDCYNIAVRSGHLCAHNYLRALGADSIIRVSMAPYNTMKEVNYFINCMRAIVSMAPVECPSCNENMSMEEVEKEIIEDFTEIGTGINQYSLITSFAGGLHSLDQNYQNEDTLVKSCQVNTWLKTDWVDERFYLEGESESVVVRGVMSLLQSIYMNRTKDEIENYHCGLIDADFVKQFLNHEQLEELTRILGSVQQQAM